MIPATSDLDEVFLSLANICSIVGSCYIGHSSPSYKAFNSDNARTGVDRTKFFQVHCSGGETRKQEHPSFLRAVPKKTKKGPKYSTPRYWRLAPDSQVFLSVSRASCGLRLRRHVFDKECSGADGSKNRADLQNDVLMAHLGLTYLNLGDGNFDADVLALT